jgi:integrase
MATARVLPSGSWRVRAYIGKDANGKPKYKSFTASTKKEAELMALQYEETVQKQDMEVTVNDAITNYINVKSKILSPATIRGYLNWQRNTLKGISQVRIKDLNSSIVQKWLGDLSVDHSPKTVKNAYGLLTATLDWFYPDIHLKVKLPQKESGNLYVPTDDNIKTLLSYFKENDKDMYIACMLAAFGTLRRSEVCALTADDISGNTITVNKAVVLDRNKEWITKSTKTTSSERTILMPEHVMKVLPKKGPIVNMHPNNITDRFGDALKKLDVPHFRFHDLRHYSASVMHAIGIPDVYIMERGGWSTPHVMQKVYRHALADKVDPMALKAVSAFQNTFQY